MTEEKGSESPASMPKVQPEVVVGRKPPLYNFISAVLIGVCIAGLTWLARSGALQMWNRPGRGKDYEFGWFFSLAFGIVGGIFLGCFILTFCLGWYWIRYGAEQRDEDA